MSRHRRYHYGATAYPHPGGCEACRDEHKCNFCGAPVTLLGACTNGRCMTCHRQECTPGGSTSPGHGFGANTPSPAVR